MKFPYYPKDKILSQPQEKTTLQKCYMTYYYLTEKLGLKYHFYNDPDQNTEASQENTYTEQTTNYYAPAQAGPPKWTGSILRYIQELHNK